MDIKNKSAIKKTNFIVILLVVFLFSIGALMFSLNLTQTSPEKAGTPEKFAVMSYLNGKVFPVFFDILCAPFRNTEMMWIVFPLIFSLLFIVIYFGRWRNEQISWNDAFANAIILFFVSVNLLSLLWVKYSSMYSVPFSVLTKFILVFVIITQAILLMVVVYLHAFPKNISFLICSPLTINIIVFLAIIIIYSDIPLNLPTFISCVMVYLLLFLIFSGIKKLIPPSLEARRYLRKKEKKKNGGKLQGKQRMYLNICS